MTDRELVEWVANAKIGDQLPDEFQGITGTRTQGIISRLVTIGVIHEGFAGQSIDELARQVPDFARSWLLLHPRDLLTTPEVVERFDQTIEDAGGLTFVRPTTEGPRPFDPAECGCWRCKASAERSAAFEQHLIRGDE